MLASLTSKIGMLNFNKKVLDNGLRVVSSPMKNTEAVTLMVEVGVGSRHEAERVWGISHLLEHLFFKGTKSRPKPGQIHRDLDEIGASHNAFTSKEKTGFWVKSSAKDFGAILDIVSDILLEPIFKSEEIEKEKGVILQEIDMYEDDPQSKTMEILENLVYAGQPIGRDIIGSKKSVAKISRGDIVRHKNTNYLSENMVVSVAGNIGSEDAFKEIKKAFRKIKKGKAGKQGKTRVFQKSPRVKITDKELDQTHLALAFRGYGRFDDRKYALNLLSVALGGNMSSKLPAEIREKLGLAYYIYAWGDQYSDCGYLGAAAGIPHGKLEDVLKKIIGVAGKIKSAGLGKKDLERAKSFVRGRMALQFEASDAVASFAADQELFRGKVPQPAEIMEKIEKVSQDDILKVAKDIFRPDKISASAVGRHERAGEKEALCEKLFAKI